jgi:hypothetical protein
MCDSLRVMAGHSASKTRVNALVSRPSRLRMHGCAFLIEMRGTSPRMTVKHYAVCYKSRQEVQTPEHHCLRRFQQNHFTALRQPRYSVRANKSPRLAVDFGQRHVTQLGEPRFHLLSKKCLQK